MPLKISKNLHTSRNFPWETPAQMFPSEFTKFLRGWILVRGWFQNEWQTPHTAYSMHHVELKT